MLVTYGRLLERFDWLMGLAVFVLLLLSLSTIYSIGLVGETPDFTNVTKQFIALSAGAIVAIIVMLWNYRLLQSYTRSLFVFGAGVLALLLLVGVERRGTTGWFDLGFFDVQPVEFVKLILIIVVAAILAHRKERQLRWREFAATAVPIGVYAFLVMLQPDFGSAALMVGVWLIMLFFAGLNKRIIAVLTGGGVLAGVLSWFVVFQDFQRARILTFFNPNLDPLGQGFNVIQARIAIGSGRLFGRGLGFGSQSQLRFLPEAQTDFMFAAIAEGLGFLGVLLVVGAFGVLLWRVWRLIVHAQDDFTGYLAAGLGGLLLLQFTINIGFNLGLLPVTGLPLPFVSYGGSSLVSSFIVFGLLQSIALRTRAVHASGGDLGSAGVYSG